MLKKAHFVKMLMFSLLCLFTPFAAQAAEQFSTDYKIIYDIADTGVTTINQTIVITNQKDDVIATNYSLNIKQLNIYDVTASDKNGSLDVSEEQSEEGHVVTVRLRSFIIGSGRQNEFTLTY